MIVPTATHPGDELLVDVDASLSEPGLAGRRRYRARRTSSFPLVLDGGEN